MEGVEAQSSTLYSGFVEACEVLTLYNFYIFLLQPLAGFVLGLKSL